MSEAVGKYVIKDFEALSGIKAHTIRIWEQRYGLLKPMRTQTNIRQYDDEELRLFLNISLLNRNGYKISALAKMKRTEIEAAVRSITATNFEFANQIDALTMAMVELDELEFERILNINIAHVGFEAAMERIIFPFLRNIGIMWQTGSINPAQEHFISNLIRQKMIVAIDRLEMEKSKFIGRSLLYLPEGELHELGLLYLNYLLRKNHQHVMYLGQDVPFRDLEKVGNLFKPDTIFSIFTTYPVHSSISEHIVMLQKIFPRTKVYLTGLIVCKQHIKPPRNIQILKDFEELREVINNLPVKNRPHFPAISKI